MFRLLLTSLITKFDNIIILHYILLAFKVPELKMRFLQLTTYAELLDQLTRIVKVSCSFLMFQLKLNVENCVVFCGIKTEIIILILTITFV